MIVTLVLVGILAAVAGLGLVNMVDSFVFTRTNADTLLKGQIVVARIIKELNNVSSIDEANTDQHHITFTSFKSSGTHTLSLSGGNLLLDGVDTLTDNVSSFTLAYHDNYDTAAQTTWSSARRIIDITLIITGHGDIASTFTARICPSIMIGV